MPERFPVSGDLGTALSPRRSGYELPRLRQQVDSMDKLSIGFCHASNSRPPRVLVGHLHFQCLRMFITTPA